MEVIASSKQVIDLIIQNDYMYHLNFVIDDLKMNDEVIITRFPSLPIDYIVFKHPKTKLDRFQNTFYSSNPEIWTKESYKELHKEFSKVILDVFFDT